MKRWQKDGTHVWYFADVDKLVCVDNLQNFYWGWFCKQVPHAVYLGEL